MLSNIQQDFFKVIARIGQVVNIALYGNPLLFKP